MKKKKTIIPSIVILSICFSLNSAIAQTTNYKAYSVFLFSFTKYVEWPADAQEGDFVIAVLGNSKIIDELQAVSSSKKVGTRNIKVIQANDASQVIRAHLVFIPDAKSSSLNDVISKTNGIPILVVTERDGLIKKGAGISFITMNDNILRFEINQNLVSEHKLRVSKSLETLAYKGS